MKDGGKELSWEQFCFKKMLREVVLYWCQLREDTLAHWMCSWLSFTFANYIYVWGFWWSIAEYFRVCMFNRVNFETFFFIREFFDWDYTWMCARITTYYGHLRSSRQQSIRHPYPFANEWRAKYLQELVMKGMWNLVAIRFWEMGLRKKLATTSLVVLLWLVYKEQTESSAEGRGEVKRNPLYSQIEFCFTRRGGGRSKMNSILPLSLSQWNGILIWEWNRFSFTLPSP